MRHASWAVALGIVVGGCGISKDVYQRDVQALQQQIKDLERDKAALIGEKQRLTDELTRLGQEKGVLSADLKAALDRMEELRQQAQRRKAALDTLKAKLQEMQAAGKLRVRTSRGLLIVEMAEQVLFDVGKYQLKPDGKAALAQLTPILATLEGRQFQVAGHTDDTGSPLTNWRLSANRALEVVLYMIEQGMPPERLSAAGYGLYAPVAPNDTPENRARNRRIEIILVPNIEEIMGIGEE